MRLLLENKHLFRTMTQSAKWKKVGRMFFARALTHLHSLRVEGDGCVEASCKKGDGNGTAAVDSGETNEFW